MALGEFSFDFLQKDDCIARSIKVGVIYFFNSKNKMDEYNQHFWHLFDFFLIFKYKVLIQVKKRFLQFIEKIL